MSVELDGATEYWRGTNFKVTDGKAGTLAVWFKPETFSTQALVAVTATGSAVTGFSLALTASATLTLVGRNPADSSVLVITSTGLTLVADTWYLALASWDLAAGTGKLYVNDIDRTGSTTFTDDSIDYTRDNWWVGASGSGVGDGATSFFDGELGYVYFATSFLNLATESNRRLFYGELGEQIGLGPNASRPTGSRPELFLAGGAGNFGRNLGSGGDLAAAGSPSRSFGRPAAVETLSRGFRGEVWRESERSGIPFPESELVREPATGLVVARREYSTDRDEIRRGRHYRRVARG